MHVDSVFQDHGPARYSITSKRDQLTIKVGDPNSTISGAHLYKISYSIDNEIVNFPDHDELFWNVTGNDWSVPIKKASVSIVSPVAITHSTCYTGEFGSKDQNCQVSSQDPLSITVSDLNSGEGLSVVAAFPPHSFTPANLTQASENTNWVLPIWADWTWKIGSLLYYLLLPLYLVFWFMRTHHKSRFGKVVVNFDLPKDNLKQRITPAEAGAIDNAKVDQKDLIATIYDFA